ncbi:MAG TPA: class D sortase [Abditibacterium sp.]|jgi:sortase A
MRRFARPLLNLTIVVGLIIAAWPLGQTIFGLWSQRSLAGEWQKTQSVQKAQKPRPARKATAVADSASPGLPSSPPRAKRAPWPLTKISIPDISLETFIVQGMDAASLRRGPGHDPNSSPPGEGNCVVAGHRNVYGSFFYRLDELLPGAPIILENRDGKWTYIVNAVFVTPDTNLTVLNPPAQGAPPILTLITCTLPHTNNRIILQAHLSEE